MRKTVVAMLLATGAALSLLVTSLAAADGGRSQVNADDLVGYQEVPAISTDGAGTFSARVDRGSGELHWTLSYNTESPAQQAHIHFGQRSVNGGISIWLCGNPSAAINPPAGTATCPASPATISGVADEDDVVGPNGQGIEPLAFDEIVAAIMAGKAYANVHSTRFPGGEIRGQLNDPNDK